MAPKKPMTDKEMFAAALAVFDRPENELHQRILDDDTDTDGFVDSAFRAMRNATIPPM